MPANVKDIINAMEKIAPSYLAETWDNVGLQVGNYNWPVSDIWIALDPQLEVVKQAAKNNASLLVTHHPLFYKKISSLNTNNSFGNIIEIAIQNKMAIFSAHTNLDKAQGGINDIWANMINLKNIEILKNENSYEYSKLTIYVPVDHEKKILESLFATNAGYIGKYSCCSFRTSGVGTFKPESGSKPFIGQLNKISEVDETRVETIVHKKDVSFVLNELKKAHPYEEMAFDIYPLLNETSKYGFGRVGNLDTNISQIDLLKIIKKKCGNSVIRMIGSPDLNVNRVAICSGSGASLLNDFYNSGAQTYITGDIKYHDAKNIEEKGLGCIDIGHFASEHIIISALVDILKETLRNMNLKANIFPYLKEKDPFIYI